MFPLGASDYKTSNSDSLMNGCIFYLINGHFSASDLRPGHCMAWYRDNLHECHCTLSAQSGPIQVRRGVSFSSIAVSRRSMHPNKGRKTK